MSAQTARRHKKAAKPKRATPHHRQSKETGGKTPIRKKNPVGSQVVSAPSIQQRSFAPDTESRVDIFEPLGAAPESATVEVLEIEVISDEEDPQRVVKFEPIVDLSEDDVSPE